jgi:hypothetical protein
MLALSTAYRSRPQPQLLFRKQGDVTRIRMTGLPASPTVARSFPSSIRSMLRLDLLWVSFQRQVVGCGEDNPSSHLQ